MVVQPFLRRPSRKPEDKISRDAAHVCENLNKLTVTDRSKAVVLLWFSVACFGVRVSVTLHFMCVHIIFSSVSVAEWPPFRK